jgi:hypothetical protein
MLLKFLVEVFDFKDSNLELLDIISRLVSKWIIVSSTAFQILL